MAQSSLHSAKKAKQDEFYTQLPDIENELKHYRAFFEGKTVFCNCDDPFESNFFRYFAMNFNFLKLKKLICTCYEGSPISHTEFSDLPLFRKNGETEHLPYLIQINEVKDENGDGAVDMADVETLLRNDKNSLTLLEGDGDFRSEESIMWLKEADVVVTNPPFSLFREYVAQLIAHDKKFIIMGNTNALTYKEIFPLFKDDKIRTGYTNFNVGMYYYVPEYCENFHKIVDGKKMVRVSTSCWFTNLPVSKHKDDIILYKKYSSDLYPKYDNYDAIEVGTYKDIPEDYEPGYLVPIEYKEKLTKAGFSLGRERVGANGNIYIYIYIYTNTNYRR